MKPIWCWRCRVEIAMLDEDEWQRLEPLLAADFERVKAKVRAKQVTNLEDAFMSADLPGRTEYERITGRQGDPWNAIRHHRVALYGPPCGYCGKPLRTPRAKHCAACGRDSR